MKTALRNGKWLGTVPFGYTKFGPYVKDENRFAARTRIEINEKGEVLKEAWKWKLRGERDYTILKRLSNRDIDLTLKQIYKMWRKPFYAGILVHGLIDEVVKGDWQPLVSKKDFVKINDNLDKNKREQVGYDKKTKEIARPLNGYLICGECGNKLVGYEKRKKIKTTGEIKFFHYYKCYHCSEVHVNANTTVRNIGVHNQFVDLLKSLRIEDEHIEPLGATLFRIINSRSQEYKQEQTILKKKITELKKELKDIKRRHAFGKLEKELYDEFSKELIDNIFELEQKSDDSDYSTSNSQKKINTALQKLQKLHKTWDSEDFEKQKNIQKLVFPHGILVQSDIGLLRTDNTSKLIQFILYYRDSYMENKKGTTQLILDKSLYAERGGFEPPVRLPVRQFSKLVD